MILTGDAVRGVLKDCLYSDEEFGPGNDSPEGTVIVEGIVNAFGFHPERLQSHTDEIMGLLLQLPEEFRRSNPSGGWSFLNACQRSDGVQWTSFHRDMDALFCLGMGVGKVTLMVPRKLWMTLPGGMPYYVIEDEKESRRGAYRQDFEDA
jgi:hypothetical protein